MAIGTATETERAVFVSPADPAVVLIFLRGAKWLIIRWLSKSRYLFRGTHFCVFG